MELLVRAAISGVIVAVASEAARHSSLVGAVIITLPLTSLLAIVWLYRDTRDTNEVAGFAWSILWIIPPSLVSSWCCRSRSGADCRSCPRSSWPQP